MGISQAMLGELAQEMANTRKTLERLPDDKFGWKPHEKSFTAKQLASHIATIPMWGHMTLTTPELDIMPDGKPPEMPEANTTAEVLRMFDENVANLQAALEKATDEEMMASWTLKGAGKTFFTMPRVAVIRGMVMNHIIHHRAQLGVYLRLNDIPVPSVYGPTADEPGMMG